MTAASTDDVIDGMLASSRRIAVVGLSDRRWRDSHGVAAALQRRGWEIVPVNPEVDEVLGVPAVDSLADIDCDVDLVDVFRRPEFLPDVAREAAAIGARGIFVQLGLRSDEAREIARAAGIPYVENRCLKVEVMRRDAHAPTD